MANTKEFVTTTGKHDVLRALFTEGMFAYMALGIDTSQNYQDTDTTIGTEVSAAGYARVVISIPSSEDDYTNEMDISATFNSTDIAGGTLPSGQNITEVGIVNNATPSENDEWFCLCKISPFTSSDSTSITITITVTVV
jgi:hypothetical protein